MMEALRRTNPPKPSFTKLAEPNKRACETSAKGVDPGPLFPKRTSIGFKNLVVIPIADMSHNF